MSDVRSQICQKHKIKMNNTSDNTFECPVCVQVNQRKFGRR